MADKREGGENFIISGLARFACTPAILVHLPRRDYQKTFQFL